MDQKNLSMETLNYQLSENNKIDVRKKDNRIMITINELTDQKDIFELSELIINKEYNPTLISDKSISFL